MNDIENFEIFTTNGFSIGITQSPFFRGNFDDIVDLMLRFDRPRSIRYTACILLMTRIVIATSKRVTPAVATMIGITEKVVSGFSVSVGKVVSSEIISVFFGFSGRGCFF